jgi:hypothetical protein
MIRGTTPTHTFTLPFDTGLIKTILITYKQNNNIKLQKWTNECEFLGDTVSVKLSQEDTLQFEGNIPVQIQIRVLTFSGDATASDVMRVRCEDVLYDGVLV